VFYGAPVEAVGAGVILESVKSAYGIAKEGGKHAGLLRQLSNLGPRQLEHALRSHRETAREHMEKLADPRRFVADWDQKDERYRAGLLKKWQAEVDNASEEASVIEGYRHEKGI
jgi:hypothetical protein